MGLYYKSIQSGILVGSKNETTFALTPVALTNAYTGNTEILETGSFSKLDIRFSYTTGAAETDNSIDILLEESDDRTNWFAIPNDATSGGTSTLTDRTFNYINAVAATNKKSSVGVDIFYKYMRISFKEAGVAANAGTIYAEYSLMGL